MKKITRMFTLTLLVSGLSLNAMDNAAQLKALETELEKQNHIFNMICAELLGSDLVALSDWDRSNFQNPQNELKVVRGQIEELKKQIRQKSAAIEKAKSSQDKKN